MAHAGLSRRRARPAVQLVCNRRRGRFDKGEFVAYSAEDERDHQH